MPRFVFFLGLLILSVAACEPVSPTAQRNYIRLEGNTMGTYYRVTYADNLDRNFQQKIDSLLLALNLEVSTYIDSAIISRFNQADSLLRLSAIHPGLHFIKNYKLAREIDGLTDGAFDPTVMPLVNFWGFGYAEKKQVTTVDSLLIDSLMQYVGLDKVVMGADSEGVFFRKETPGIQLDFSGIAKGYGVDIVGLLLEEHGVRHYLVDIGGEARARGESPRNDTWAIGINVPREEAGLTEIQTALPLRDRSIATSGNYRNFYEVNGVKYSHTINPISGFPERNTLLSASVIASDCATADAFATAFMVMGTERAFQLAQNLPELDAYFVFSLPDGGMAVKYTNGLRAFFDDEQ